MVILDLISIDLEKQVRVDIFLMSEKIQYNQPYLMDSRHTHSNDPAHAREHSVLATHP